VVGVRGAVWQNTGALVVRPALYPVGAGGQQVVVIDRVPTRSRREPTHTYRR
jgi:hypothetical protein